MEEDDRLALAHVDIADFRIENLYPLSGMRIGSRHVNFLRVERVLQDFAAILGRKAPARANSTGGSAPRMADSASRRVFIELR
jgi:hypothetical protein